MYVRFAKSRGAGCAYGAMWASDAEIGSAS